MACNSKGLSLVEEEKLSETVRNFPVLYDKSKKGYKERDAVKNAWTEVARSLDFIENWDDAKNLFENFKKQYLKKEMQLEKQINLAHLQPKLTRHKKIMILIGFFLGSMSI